MNHQIRAVLNRALQGRREQTIVNGEQCIRAFGNICKCGDIADFRKRIRRRFAEQEAGIRSHGSAPFVYFGGCHPCRLDAKFPANLIKQRHHRAKHATRRNNVVAALQEPHHGARDRRHASGGGNARLSAFQGRQAILKHADGWVGEPAIYESGFFIGKPSGRFGRIRVHEAGCQR